MPSAQKTTVFAWACLAATALADTVSERELWALPDPPACVMDCHLFDHIATGEVDDCAILTAWTTDSTDDSCMADCSLAGAAIVDDIATIFCAHESRELSGSSSYGGSYGYSSYAGSDAEDTAMPTSTPTGTPTATGTPTTTPTAAATLPATDCTQCTAECCNFCTNDQCGDSSSDFAVPAPQGCYWDPSVPNSETNDPSGQDGQCTENDDVTVATASPTATPTATPAGTQTPSPTIAPLVIAIQMELTFNDVLSEDAISSVSKAIQDELADSGGFSSDYVSVSLELKSSETRRRLLSFVYDTDITITFPALGPDDGAVTEYIQVLISSEGASTLTASIVSIPELAEANGGEEVLATVTSLELDDPNDGIEDPTGPPTSNPTANEESSALSAGPAFSIATIISVAYALQLSASI